MAQTPSVYKDRGDRVDYTSGSAVLAGTVVARNSLVGVVSTDLAANELGSLAVKGVFDMPHDAVIKAAGEKVYWKVAGDPVGGTAGSGCVTKTLTGNTYAGKVVGAVTATDTSVRVRLEQ